MGGRVWLRGVDSILASFLEIASTAGAKTAEFSSFDTVLVRAAASARRNLRRSATRRGGLS